VKPTRFRYHDPSSVDEAVGLLDDLGDECVLLAGGQSLVPMMNLRLVQANDIVDLNRVDGLAELSVLDGALVIGAMVRHRAVEHSIDAATLFPALVEAVRHVGYPAIRARGTIGGSVAHADPAAELACTLVALGGIATLASRGGRREVLVEDLLAGPYSTRREPNELLVELRVPRAEKGTVTAFVEFAAKSGEFALALVAVSLTVDDGVCHAAHVAIGGVGPCPTRARDAEARLSGSRVDEAAIAAAAAAAAAAATPSGDAHGSADYRRRLVAVLVRRALETAIAEQAA
jgi:CO/xanthine dehydrogenase FAD-binding subunit